MTDFDREREVWKQWIRDMNSTDPAAKAAANKALDYWVETGEWPETKDEAA
ncbi:MULTISPECIES: hypothetical protein [Nocardia]|uniref:hypothetical protein n=1 Tax=Nocardia TaxID=1817 RepID=UPI0013006CB1|nr:MULTISPECIES: hypothetical protein [Nocardia]